MIYYCPYSSWKFLSYNMMVDLKFNGTALCCFKKCSYSQCVAIDKALLVIQLSPSLYDGKRWVCNIIVTIVHMCIVANKY